MFFNQASAKKNIKYIHRVPKIFVRPEALQKMRIYVNKCDKEIGWFGSAVKTDFGDIVVEDVFLFKQEVSGSTNEITAEGISEFAMDLLNDKTLDGCEIYNKIRVWGHSHVNMGIYPSQQDEKQFMFFQESGQEWFVRVICNKKGDICFDYVDYISGVRIDDLEWEVMLGLPDIEAKIEEEIKSKVSSLSMAKKVPILNEEGFRNFKLGLDMSDYLDWSHSPNKSDLKRNEIEFTADLADIAAEFNNDATMLAEIGSCDKSVGCQIIFDQVGAVYSAKTRVDFYEWCVANKTSLLNKCIEDELVENTDDIDFSLLKAEDIVDLLLNKSPEAIDIIRYEEREGNAFLIIDNITNFTMEKELIEVVYDLIIERGEE